MTEKRSVPNNEFSEHMTGDMCDESTRTPFRTAEANNLPLTGKIDLDKNFYRRPPNYDPESFTYSMRELQNIGSSCLEETVANFLLLLKMRTHDEIAKRIDSERAIQNRQEMNEEERLRKDD